MHPVSQEFCQARIRTVNFLLSTIAVIAVCFLGMATWSVSIANETSGRVQEIDATVNHQLGANDEFRERVLADLAEIKTQLAHLQERGE
jgi:hypothetical protein